jgi:hypothetical protein
MLLARWRLRYILALEGEIARMKQVLTSVLLLSTSAALGFAQMGNMGGAKKAPASPAADTSVTIAGKAITIKYSAPSMRGRTDIFGKNGVIGKDANYPVWRAGANSATALHTDADLDIKGLAVPKGDYTLYVFLNDGNWQLIVNKQTGQWGLTYSQAQDLGRVAMDMSKPPSPIETYKMTLTSAGGNAGKLQLEWADVVASVPFTVK